MMEPGTASQASEQNKAREQFQDIAFHRGKRIIGRAGIDKRQSESQQREQEHAPLADGETVRTNKAEEEQNAEKHEGRKINEVMGGREGER